MEISFLNYGGQNDSSIDVRKISDTGGDEGY